MSVCKKSGFLAFVSVFLLLFSVMLSVDFFVPAKAVGTIYVDVNNLGDPLEDGSLEHPFDVIQEGVNAASMGGIVQVAAGTYFEHVVVKKSLALLGEGRSVTFIDGGGKGTVVTVVAEGVTISGFTIRNSGWSPLEVLSDGGIIIKGYGGIFLNYSGGHTIRANTIINNQRGIVISHSDGSDIFDNTITQSPNYNVILKYSTNNTLANNTISFAHADNILLWGSYQNAFRDNVIASSEHAGMVLKHYSGNNTIIGNTLSESEWSIYLVNYCGGNTIFHNNFINDVNTAYNDLVLNVWDDGYPSGGNYWSDYEERYPDAEELDDSGIWDTPYVIDENNEDRYPLVGIWDVFPPVAYAGPDQRVRVGTVVAFNASGSTDNLGIVSYEWDFGDGTNGTGVIATHAYEELGTCNFTLTFKDGVGNGGTDSVVIIVEAAPVGFMFWVVGVVVAVGVVMAVAAYLLKVRKSKDND